MAAVRTYRSSSSQWSSFGVGWSFSYDSRVILGDDPDLDQLSVQLQSDANSIKQTYDTQNGDYNTLVGTLNTNLATIQGYVAQAETAYAASLGAVQTAQEIATSDSGRQSYITTAQTIAAQAYQNLVDLQADETSVQNQLNAIKDPAQSPLTALARIQSYYQQVSGLATTVAQQDTLAKANRQKNRYALHAEDPDNYRGSGVDSVTLIDGAGVPHLYHIVTAPTARRTISPAARRSLPRDRRMIRSHCSLMAPSSARRRTGQGTTMASTACSRRSSIRTEIL